MVSLKIVLGVNTGIFVLIGLLHVLRIIMQWPAQIGTWTVPVWLSGVAVVIAAILVWVNTQHLQ